MEASQPIILVVEDDNSIRETLKEALESEGYCVWLAGNGDEALAKIRSTPRPNMVLLDLLLPGMSGREFLDQVLEDPKLTRIPVFVISASANRESARGAVGFLGKPFDLGIVLQVVHKYVRRSERVRPL